MYEKQIKSNQSVFIEDCMARREEQRSQAREKILAAAATCFAEKGYSGCSVQDIADRAGMSKGALYVYYKSKEELLKSMFVLEHNSAKERMEEATAVPPFLNGIISFMSQCITNGTFPMDHRLWAEVLAVAARDPSIKRDFVESERAMRKFWVGMLQKAAKAGEIDSALDLDSTAIWLIALGDGLILRVADDPEYDFQKNLPLFEMLVRRALRP
jgi:AcrR family transcriptional regulator